MSDAGIELRRATVDDLEAVLPRTRALNEHEGIALTEAGLRASLRELLATPALGGVWHICEHGVVLGYAIVTYCFDLEFGGREGWLTELWIDEPARGRGIATAVMPKLEAVVRAEGVRALHLQARPENPAVRLYQRLGFSISPRHIMTRRFV